MDGIPFYIHEMKEPNYVMMLMSTYGTLNGVGENKKHHYEENGVKKTTEFRYPEVVYNHYRFRDMIDNHNSFRMHPISMEETWMTMRWANHVFCFLLAITVVNIQNAAVYFLNKVKLDALQSRRQIMKQLIFNVHLEQEQASRKHSRLGYHVHTLTMVPINKKFNQGRLVNCKTKYGKWKCTNCPKFLHSYCSCTPGALFCTDCFGDHHAEVAVACNEVTSFGELQS